MKILTYAVLVLGFLCTPFLGCGSSDGQKPDATTGGAVGTGGISGTGGGSGTGGAVLPYDGGAQPGSGGTIAPIDSGTSACTKTLDCTGLAAPACHDLFANPACLPDGVLAQDPGPDPVPAYPACAAQ